ncbi:hypothetical protein MGAD_21040 [Mycolicibacterium gadium]|uniref:Uncharacterized protein n=1 Tax=Mycolicibacterium gadium TaxID=1794 RepID=A0A7I7WJF7_MYCGU|nr:hypothetical protein MGAD_21040 [Mycolicibacterium gadium]
MSARGAWTSVWRWSQWAQGAFLNTWADRTDITKMSDRYLSTAPALTMSIIVNAVEAQITLTPSPSWVYTGEQYVGRLVRPDEGPCVSTDYREGLVN